MKKISRLLVILLLTLSLAVFLTNCGSSGGGGSDSDSSSGLNYEVGYPCDPDFPGDCSTGMCIDDSLGCRDGMCGFGGMCTMRCSSDSDCAGHEGVWSKKFGWNNTETMVCRSSGYCGVDAVTISSGGGNSCSGCGGAFCSGKCIGCPQC